MSYSGNLFLPDFVTYNKRQKKITQDENWHIYRDNFLKTNTGKNTFIVIYGDYNYYFEKRIKFKNNEIIEYPTLDIFAERKILN